MKTVDFLNGKATQSIKCHEMKEIKRFEEMEARAICFRLSLRLSLARFSFEYRFLFSSHFYAGFLLFVLRIASKRSKSALLPLAS